MRTLRIALAWLLVSIPLAWGVTRSVQKSLPLFKSSQVPQSQSTTAPNPR